MELIKITHDNLEQEHICCAIANNKDIRVLSKKNWLRDRFDEGLVFLKCNVRGKCFIEYIPAEYAWTPIKAEGYMYIDTPCKRGHRADACASKPQGTFPIQSRRASSGGEAGD